MPIERLKNFLDENGVRDERLVSPMVTRLAEAV